MKQRLLNSIATGAVWWFIPYKQRKTFGEQVRETRIKKGLTQAELAERACMSQARISDIERYDWSPGVRIDAMSNIAVALDCVPRVEITAWEDVRAYHGPAF